MSLSVALTSQKNSISSNVSIQNTLNKKNPNSAQNSDSIASEISIFSTQIRDEIRRKALEANNTSSQVLFNKINNKNKVLSSVNNVNSNISELQSLMNWTSSASSELSDIAGMPTDALNAIQMFMTDTIRYGSTTINNSVSQAKEAIAKIASTGNSTLSTNVQEAREKLNNVTQSTDQVQSSIVITNANASTNAAKTEAQTDTANAEAAKPAETKPAENKPADNKTADVNQNANANNTVTDDPAKKKEAGKLDVQS